MKWLWIFGIEIRCTQLSVLAICIITRCKTIPRKTTPAHTLVWNLHKARLIKPVGSSSTNSRQADWVRSFSAVIASITSGQNGASTYRFLSFSGYARLRTVFTRLPPEARSETYTLLLMKLSTVSCRYGKSVRVLEFLSKFISVSVVLGLLPTFLLNNLVYVATPSCK